MAVREVRGIQHLNTCLMVAVERRRRGRAVGRCSIVGVGEPQSHVINLNRSGGWIAGRVVGKHGRRWRRARRVNERLAAEDAGEISDSMAAIIRDNVALIPNQPERRVGDLKEKRRELRVCRKVEYFHVHVLNRSQIADADPTASLG